MPITAVEKPKDEVVKSDPYKTPKETWQYVTIPEEDPLGKGFATISLNKYTFEAGKTYQVPPEVAAYVNDRIKVFNRSCVRLLQPNVDLKAQHDTAYHGSAVRQQEAAYVDATRIQTL